MGKYSLDEAVEEFEDQIEDSLTFLKTAELTRFFRFLAHALKVGDFRVRGENLISIEYRTDLDFRFVASFIKEAADKSSKIGSIGVEDEDIEVFTVFIQIPNIKDVITLNGEWDDL